MSGKTQLDPVIAEAAEPGGRHGEAYANYVGENGGCPFGEPAVPHRYSINNDRRRTYLDAYDDAVDRTLAEQGFDVPSERRTHEESCGVCDG